ncbi:MAG: hypothetical protein GY946_02175 [bacterium]|nr:hypothetical protein [bacterium]
MPAASPEVDSDLLLSADRARVYRALAQLFRTPDGQLLGEARERNLPELCESLERLTEGASDSGDGSALVGDARALCELFEDTGVERLRRGHELAFDESSSIRCAPTEMDQLDGTPQLELTRTFEMADVGGFYKAFGVELGDSDLRVDHIAAELEFMNLLAVKEFTALKEEGPGEHSQICRDASRVFLRDHLVRWAPRLGECLSAADGDPIYSAAGRLLGTFIVFDAEQIDADGAPVHVIDPAARIEEPESL